MDIFGLHQSPAILLYLVPGQGDWDNSVTSWQNGDYANAFAWGGMMVADQALFVASFGRCNATAAQVLKQEVMAAEARAAAALEKEERALAAWKAARDAASKANDNMRRALDRMNQFPNKDSLPHISADEAWRAAQKEVTDAQKAYEAAKKTFQDARAAAAAALGACQK